MLHQHSGRITDLQNDNVKILIFATELKTNKLKKNYTSLPSHNKARTALAFLKDQGKKLSNDQIQSNAQLTASCNGFPSGF